MTSKDPEHNESVRPSYCCFIFLICWRMWISDVCVCHNDFFQKQQYRKCCFKPFKHVEKIITIQCGTVNTYYLKENIKREIATIISHVSLSKRKQKIIIEIREFPQYNKKIVKTFGV